MLADDGSAASLQHAAARSVDYLQRLAPERTFAAVDRRVKAGELAAMLNALSGPVAEWPARICERFRVYRVEGGAPLLVTGYYEPELPASRTRTERFRYPLYRAPDDLVHVDLRRFCPACDGRSTEGRVEDGSLVPYYSRAQIEAGALAGRGYEIAWLDDPIEAFFVHIQGSALLRFGDGVHMQVSYSRSNGRPYTSIGRVLIAQGKLARGQVSLQTLRDYLRAHPGEGAALMATNQRYIFFRTVVAGPIGSLGVPLTAGRSLAADAAVYPPGALGFLRIHAGRGLQGSTGSPAISRFTFMQDAGVAITGANRLDVFWGTGRTAEALAGGMRNGGELYLVLPQ